jgi:hypothetical protein
MNERANYYQDLAADYSCPGLVSPELAQKLIQEAERIVALKEPKLPQLNADYTFEQIELENKEWWTTHCEALRQGRGDILTGEYRDDLIYFCQDGPYYGLEQQKEREKHWWALIAQPEVTMCWPIVMFWGEHTYFGANILILNGIVWIIALTKRSRKVMLPGCVEVIVELAISKPNSLLFIAMFLPQIDY